MSVHYLPGRGFDANVFLVDGEQPFLVDTGTGTRMDDTLDRLRRITTPQDIDRIILTHCHFDHAGGARALSNKLDSEVFIHRLEAPSVESGDDYRTQATMFGEHMEEVGVTAIDEGRSFSSGEEEYRVIHTPGHSAGSIALYHQQSGSLIGGDTVFVGGIGRWDLPGGDYESIVRSLKQLLELKPNNLYPGHGLCDKGGATDHIVDALAKLGES